MSGLEGWIGVDLDRTLALYSKFVSPTHIGKPVPLMLARVKQWLSEGRQVKIVTARACSNQPAKQRAEVIAAVKAWCLEHVGQELDVTAEKDFDMVELWDDRAVAVMPNSGEQLTHSRFPLTSVN